MERYNEGLIIGTACLGGYIPKLLVRGEIDRAREGIERFLDIFGREIPPFLPGVGRSGHFVEEVFSLAEKPTDMQHRVTVIPLPYHRRVWVVEILKLHRPTEADYIAHRDQMLGQLRFLRQLQVRKGMVVNRHSPWLILGT
jgi:hypothetical protein